MSTDTDATLDHESVVDDNRETLEVVADGDDPAAEFARRILDAYEGGGDGG